MTGLDELLDLVHEAGGVETLAAYLDLEPQTLEAALSAPEGAWTDRVSQMVAENTSKLIQMPSQAGFFWRLTRRRVVKDWRLLARWSEAHPPSDVSFAPRPDRPPRTASGTSFLPWPVMLRVLEKRYGLSPDEPWSTEAEARFTEDMTSVSVGTAEPELRRIHLQLTDPETIASSLSAQGALRITGPADAAGPRSSSELRA